MRRLGRRGIAAAEFALLAPVLLMVLLAGSDAATAVQTSIALERAVRSAAQYAAFDSSDMAAIQARVIAAWPVLTTADVPLPTVGCECAGTATACTASCASGLAKTVTITAQRHLGTYLLPAMALGSGHAVVRLR